LKIVYSLNNYARYAEKLKKHKIYEVSGRIKEFKNISKFFDPGII